MDNKIINATYGKIKIINVLNIIKKYTNKKFKVSNKIFKIDPEPDIVKELILYFNNGDKMIIKEGSICDLQAIKKQNKNIQKIKSTKIIDIKRNDTSFLLRKSHIYVRLTGGFGNQLFMLFNAISASIKYKKKLIVYYNDKYEELCLVRNIIRKSPTKYKTFKNIKFTEMSNLKNYIEYKEPTFTYKDFKLLDNKNYILTGYFQSFNYFWDNINIIKDNLYIDMELINNIKDKLNKFNKKIIAIHYRLGDYLNNPDVHPVLPIEYFKMALSYYNLDDYTIILFSDDTKMAADKLKDLHLNYIIADDLYSTDEEQFYILCLSNIRICSNSSYSLMSCYFNEMYNFISDAEYIFPYKWFGNKGPKYNMNDLMLNYKFYVINYDNPPIKKYDVVSCLHIKDKNRYNKFLPYNKKFLLESNKYYYISTDKYDEIEAEHISEDLYPFSKNDVFSYICKYIPENRCGWYYQQLLKLYIFNVIKSDYVLILDADILLLKNLYLFEGNTPILFKRNTGNKVMHLPYFEFLKIVYPKLNYDKQDSGICHFMLFKRLHVEALLNDISIIHNKPAWQGILDSVIKYIQLFKYNTSIMSEYELYYHYIKSSKTYKYINNLEYCDTAFIHFNPVNTKYTFIGDHDYLTNNINASDTNLIEHNIFNKYNEYINNLFINYQLYNIKNREYILNTNKEINKYLESNKVNICINNIDYKDIIMKSDYLLNNLQYGNYDSVYIYRNINAKLKNHIIILCKNPPKFDEIILNVNYIIISDSIIDYIYVKPLCDYDINDVEYIIYDDIHNELICNIDICIAGNSKHTLFTDFIANKILFLQICIPSFENLPDKIKAFSEHNNEIFWNIKLDKNLCDKFIKTNYHYYMDICYNLIYSITSRTDLLRHLFLYKYGGCYFDLSVKVCNDMFYELLYEYDFITSRDENYDLLQNGILFIKNKNSIISNKMIIELLSGVFNYNLNINNKKSFLYNIDSTTDSFFYGPITLFNIYNEIRDDITYKCKILNTFIKNKIKINNSLTEFESYAYDNDIKYLQVKYIGYNNDLRSALKNPHYSLNYRNKLYYYSPLNLFDKIIIINLEHRKDRRKEIINELNKFIISPDKIYILDAVYIKNDGALGCTMSHINALEYAITNNLNNVIILEDDFCFPQNIEQFNENKFNENILRFMVMNIKWDCLLFTISEYGPPVNINTNIDGIFKNLWSQSAAGYAINKSIFTELQNIYSITKNINKCGIDYYWNVLRTKYDFYIVKDTLGSQRKSYSDIENKNVNYKFINK